MIERVRGSEADWVQRGGVRCHGVGVYMGVVNARGYMVKSTRSDGCREQRFQARSTRSPYHPTRMIERLRG